MHTDTNQEAFLELVRAGLWEKEARLSKFGNIDYTAIIQLAEEQSVVGLVTAGLEHVQDVKVPQEWLLQFIGSSLQIEQQNKAMNSYINHLLIDLRNKGVHALLIKGQGIAQCYERPLWRTSGDIDFLLDADNYERAKKYLAPLASALDKEYTYLKHLGMTIDGWVVELHGTFLSRLSKRIDIEIEKIQESVFKHGGIRIWKNGDVDVHLPSVDNDVFFLFTHFLRHFFFEGIGLRQICDWCRLLWTYRETIDFTSLEERLKKMGLMTEWKAFASYAVEYLGMPFEAMPLYSAEAHWSRKASKINTFVLSVGNFGHKQRRNFGGQSYLVRKLVSVCGRWSDMLRHFSVFPKDSIVFLGGVLRSGLYAVVRGE